MRPSARGRTGRVTSSRSASSRASSARSARRARRAVSAASTSCFNALNAWPASRRCSGGSPPSRFTSSVTLPCLPSAATRTSSRAARSPAAATRPMMSLRRSSSATSIRPSPHLPRTTKKGPHGPSSLVRTTAPLRAPPGHACRAASACLTKPANAAPSWTAMSARTLRSSPMPASFSPCINRP